MLTRIYRHHLQDPLTDPQAPDHTHPIPAQNQGIEEVRKVKEGDGGSGIVVMDMVGEGGDWDLVRLVIGLNMGILNKVKDGYT